MEEKYTAITTVAILLLTVFDISNFPLANSQTEQPLPVLLIHGYFSNALVWETWEELLGTTVSQLEQ